MVKLKVEKPRGVLNLKEGEKKFRLSLYVPGQEPGFFVDQYWIVSWDLRGGEPYRQEVLPHPCVHMVIDKGRSGVFGVMKGKFSYLLEGKGRVFGVKFKPGGFYPFVKRSVATFTNEIISFWDAFGVEERAMEEAVLSLEDEGMMVAFVEGFLCERLAEQDENVVMVNQIIECISADREIIRVDDVVSRLHLHKRALQRLFSQYVGVSPKWVIQRYRLHEAAEQLVRGEGGDWAKLALELGYFDQAHFIKDFRAIVGRAPGEYVSTIDSGS